MKLLRRKRAETKAILAVALLAIGAGSAACDERATSPRVPPTDASSSARASSPSTSASSPLAPPSPAASSSTELASPSTAPSFVLLLHGLGGSGGSITRHFRFDVLSRELGFSFQAPDGDVDGEGRRFWNAGESCCDFDGRGPDHVAVLGALLARERAAGRRVFVVGYSNGGFMAHRLACDVEGVDGILSVAGPSPPDVGPCKFAPARVLHVHGDADPVVRFEGGEVFSNGHAHASAEASVLGWAKKRGCDEGLAAKGELDLEPRIDGPETVLQNAACAPNLTLFRVRGGAHDVVSSRASMEALMRRLLE